MAPHCTTSAMCKRPADLVVWRRGVKSHQTNGPFGDGDSRPFGKVRPVRSHQGKKLGRFESLGDWVFCGFQKGFYHTEAFPCKVLTMFLSPLKLFWKFGNSISVQFPNFEGTSILLRVCIHSRMVTSCCV